MKVIDRDIFLFQEKDFFAPVRDKVDYARIAILAARLLLLNIKGEKTEINSTMKLIVDKMSRLFFYRGDKVFSISFPFVAITEANIVTEITSYSGKKIDNKTISAIIAILDSSEFRLNPSLIDFYIEPNNIESSGIFLLEEIFQFEPSYVRYDFDPVRVNGKIHPLYHVDINYSQYGTFKLGLGNVMTKPSFEDLHNIRTDCYYLTI